MSISVITIEGVLRQAAGDGVIPAGQVLYQSLTSSGKVALVSNSLNEEKVEYWLRINGFNHHEYLFCAEVTDPFEVGGTRVRQMSAIKAHQHSVDLVIEPDPEIAARLMHEGVTTLLFLHPRYSRPEFRPDYEEAITPWDQLVAEVETQTLLKAGDTRPHED